MIKKVVITPLPATKRQFIADRRQRKTTASAAKKLSAALQGVRTKRSVFKSEVEVDPVEFSRAFSWFRSDISMLSDEEQLEFQFALRQYMGGVLDSEEWREIIAKLRALARVTIGNVPLQKRR